MRERTDLFVRIAAWAGIIGPLLFGGMVIVLTITQYDFMRSLHWHPLTAPTTDWPSGLALGPQGLWMTATFIISGALLVLFGQGVRVMFPVLGASLLSIAGLALACLAFPTDPTFRSTPATLYGTVHDASYVVLGLTLLPGMVLLSRSFRKQQSWRWLATLTILVLILIIPAFVFKGVLFYIFLAGIFGWCLCVSVQTLRVSYTRLH